MAIFFKNKIATYFILIIKRVIFLRKFFLTEP